jgi:uncharacterized glyoxalase superfamily protein PhnB
MVKVSRYHPLCGFGDHCRQHDAGVRDGVLAPSANRSLVLDFEVENVDAHHARLKGSISEWVLAPTDMPWGNRAMLFRDPDGNLINFFSQPASAGS